MNLETEEFEPLRHLLAAKRYEQPPPGYFTTFSSKVIARVEAGEQGEGALGWEERFWRMAWLQRVWSALEAKPVFAGALGVVLCGLVITGIVFSEKLASSNVPTVAGSSAVAADNLPALVNPPALMAEQRSDFPVAIVASTNALNSLAGSPKSSLFDQIPLQTWPVNGRAGKD
jgi:hypothetical protein